MPKLYRKKPIEIEAMQFKDDSTTITALSDWIKDDLVINFNKDEKPTLLLKCREGQFELPLGTYIIKGATDFFPCPREEFEAVYEAVN